MIGNGHPQPHPPEGEPQPRLPGVFTDRSWRKGNDLMGYSQYEALVSTLRINRMQAEMELSSMLWWLADALIAGENDLGEDFWQMVDETGYTKESLSKIRRTAEEFPPEQRHDPRVVSFWTHWDVRNLSVEKRRELLEKYATDPHYSREDMRDEARILLDADEAESTIIEGAGEAPDDTSDLPPCPLCQGAGAVTPDRRDAYLMEEGSAYTAVRPRQERI